MRRLGWARCAKVVIYGQKSYPVRKPSSGRHL